MEKVTGIGGMFFRAKDPEGLAEWYHAHLGVDPAGPSPWRQAEGYTVFAPFDQDTLYFGRSEQQWMINFRVGDLDKMIAQLQAAGIDVITKPEWDTDGVGRFARVHDPEGNPVELWEPAKSAN